jgi:uncharacterized protein YjbI with pentapeptide repeats
MRLESQSCCHSATMGATTRSRSGECRRHRPRAPGIGKFRLIASRLRNREIFLAQTRRPLSRASADGLQRPKLGKQRTLRYPAAIGTEQEHPNDPVLSACTLAVCMTIGATGSAAAQRQINGCGIEPQASCRAADLAAADLSMAQLRGADLRGANLAGANLRLADLREADLTGAMLQGALLAGAKLEGVTLTGADLSGVNLYSAELDGADLAGADLRAADLGSAELRSADLSRADLTRAKLFRADLSRADLAGANLTGADLSWANLFGADLTNANLAKATLRNAELGQAELTGAAWVTTATCGPGSVGECRLEAVPQRLEPEPPPA